MRQSFVRKERRDGSAHWGQRFVFACPVPVKNRQVALELYRTSSSTRKGRLVASTQVRRPGLGPSAHPQRSSQGVAALHARLAALRGQHFGAC